VFASQADNLVPGDTNGEVLSAVLRKATFVPSADSDGAMLDPLA
jgi:hypothetical protein